MFVKHNANPKNKKTDDCTTRALAVALNKKWDAVLKMQVDLAMEYKLFPNDKKITEEILINNGFKKIDVKPEKGGYRHTPQSLSGLKGYKVIVASVAKHLTVIKNNNVMDTWDCSHKGVYRAYGK